MRIGARETWSLSEAAPPKPRPEFDSTKGVIVTVGRQRLKIVPNEQYEHVDGYEIGKDGSLLIHRAHRENRWESLDAIWYAGEEKNAEGRITHFHDRLNYAGSVIREMNAIGMPESAPEAYLMENGKRRNIGWGAINDLGKDGVVVLEVPVDRDGHPTGTEFTAGAVTRIVHGKKEWRINGYGFLGRQKDGTIVLASGNTSDSVGNGYMSLAKTEIAADRVLLWRNDAFVAHYAIPRGWRVAGAAPDGWLLFRHVSKPLSMAEFDGEEPEKFEKASTEKMLADERDWTVGVFQKGVVTTVQFAKPKGAEKLLWRGGGFEFGPKAFRFSAFWGDDQRYFQVARR